MYQCPKGVCVDVQFQTDGCMCFTEHKRKPPLGLWRTVLILSLTLSLSHSHSLTICLSRRLPAWVCNYKVKNILCPIYFVLFGSSAVHKVSNIILGYVKLSLNDYKQDVASIYLSIYLSVYLYLSVYSLCLYICHSTYHSIDHSIVLCCSVWHYLSVVISAVLSIIYSVILSVCHSICSIVLFFFLSF